ncbi:unnamed protein product [Blepharisma stoltei]|uniref:Uncharacterized protein n=1 Tax=Blepharisma stoltei TaxID=1481888 RepID=A0AAU9K4U5_9CILI|nr:unnamed protein product [Blepharisma stoltei]
MNESELMDEFEEFKETSKLIEAELELEIEENKILIKSLQEEILILKEQNTNLKSQFYTKIQVIEKLNSELNEKLKKSCQDSESSKKKLMEMELEMDMMKSKLREKDFEAEQLNEFYNKTLEDLAIACSELDVLKEYSEENTQRLKDQISDLNNELMVARRKSIDIRAYLSRSDSAISRLSIKSSLDGQSSKTIVDILLSNLNANLMKYKQNLLSL